MDQISILVTTDNHVGYNEDDPVRGSDAAVTFNEIMKLAKQRDVDMIVQAGDLFHINKPSKRSLYQVIKSLRLNCLGDKPVSLEVMNQGMLALDSELDHVNFLDPNYNISIPVFTISGNHDDSGGMGMLSPLDVLGATGLVNHFGRVIDNDDIVIAPILLKKGTTKLALYGLASVRDERLFRTFRSGKVKFLRPQEDPDSWFSILCVHQNHSAHTTTSYLPEKFLPPFLDLVIWGHEHECLIDPVENPVTGFQVMQPGSSVATSISEGEAKAKYVAILKIRGKRLDVEKIRLQTVRPMAMETVSLKQSGIPPSRDSRHAVAKWLNERIDRLIEMAKDSWREANPDRQDEPPLPLVRLRVDYTGGYEVENPTRFSNRFVGRVANANDVVQFMKKKTSNRAGEPSLVTAQSFASVNESTSEEKAKLSDLVHQYLKQQELGIIPETGMDEAITQFVDKEDKSALKAFVDESLASKIKELLGPLETHAINARYTGTDSTISSKTAASKRTPKSGARTAPKSACTITKDDEEQAVRDAEGRAAALAEPDDSDVMIISDDEVGSRSLPLKAKPTSRAPRARRLQPPARATARQPRTTTHASPPVPGALDSDDGF